MRGIVCLGDSTDHGGKVITASSTLYYEGIPAALAGDLVACPLPGHGVNPIIEGCNTMQDNGKAVAVNNCLCQCGCRVLTSMSHNSVEA
ncbi:MULTISPECIES: PAAR domain-containing protein [unclassified Brenneria]|uniref:PAAR domain-containing protein n=1 Tax=unclassified Brenneria TaxID=2634434 RepID=UPI0029C25394|nr:MULTISPECIES: PAAR domain-containing protein [unclassified Brenneria]MDX5631154.1 PAAR domain-containing protein [Brenneria sp. L3-3Z]MDX5698244.1 PAAR domain-containing protein [Brenneria sp. L4-2C]MEE3664137.1 PAAR domain-containing protein [Brenneria sp. g21c3]